MKKILLFLSWWLDLSKWNTGVWPNSWWWWRVLLPKQKKFYQPACVHDVWYTQWWDDLERYKIDVNFHRDCLRNSSSKSDIFFANLYYWFVRVFWEKFFNYKTTKK